MWHLFATPKKMLYDYTTLFLKWSDIGNLISTRVEDVRVSKMCLLGTGHASQNPCKSMDAPNDHERTCLTDGSGACYVVLSLMLSQLYIVIWIYNKLYTDHCYCYFILMNITTITCYYYLFVYYNVVKKLYIYIYILNNIAISFVIVLHIVKPALYHWRAALRCPRCALNIFNCPSASFALPASRSGSLGGLLDDNLWYIIEK